MKTTISRRSYAEKISYHRGVDFSTTLCRKTPKLLFSCSLIVENIYRYDKRLTIDIFCPKIMQEYNIHKGEVDLMDGHLDCYDVRAKAAKSISAHFVICRTLLREETPLQRASKTKNYKILVNFIKVWLMLFTVWDLI